MIQHLATISGVAAHENGLVASAGYDNQVILWDINDQKAISRSLHDHLANQVTFNQDGTLLLSSSSDYTARIWSVPDLKLLAVLGDHDDDVEMSVFHPTLPLVATASRDHTIGVYSHEGTLLARLRGHEADVISVAWSDETVDGQPVLISSSDDGTIKKWSVAKKEVIQDYDLGGVETDTIAITSGGVIFAGNDEGQMLRIVDGNVEAIDAHRAGIKRLILSEQSSKLLSLSYDRTMIIWDLASGLKKTKVTDIPSIVWPRSGAFVDNNRVVFSTFGTTYASYNISQDKWSLSGINDTHGVNAVALNNDQIITVGDAGIVRKENVEVAQVGSLCNFLCNLDGRMITGGQLGAVYDAFSGEPLYEHTSPLNCATSFERHGEKWCAVGTYTGELLFFSDIDSQFELKGIVKVHENAVKGVAYRKGYIFSVAADSSATYTNVKTFEVEESIENAHFKIANACCRAGDMFASVSRDLNLRLWPSQGGKPVLVETPHDHSIKCCAASPEGRFIATGSYNGVVAVYDTQNQAWSAHRPTAHGISSLTWGEGKFLAGSYDGKVYAFDV